MPSVPKVPAQCDNDVLRDASYRKKRGLQDDSILLETIPSFLKY